MKILIDERAGRLAALDWEMLLFDVADEALMESCKFFQPRRWDAESLESADMAERVAA